MRSTGGRLTLTRIGKVASMALYILDTDILTLLRVNHPEVSLRVAATAINDVVTTVITADEMLTGWYGMVRRAAQPAAIESAYARLADIITFLTGLRILNFTVAAIARFEQLRKLKLNVAKNDLRIAAIALEAGAIVVTRNARDFGRVPSVVIEDWSLPPLASPAPPAAP